MGDLSILSALGGIAIAVLAVIAGIWGLVRFIVKISQWLDRVAVGISGTGARITDLEKICRELRADLREETKQRRAEVRDAMERLSRVEEAIK